MVGVLVDACGWVAVVEARINIDLALEQQIGPVELKVTERVIAELSRLEAKGTPTLISLLTDRAETVSGEGAHTDDELLDLALRESWPVLTVDRALKGRLHAANASVIEVVGSKALRWVE